MTVNEKLEQMVHACATHVGYVEGEKTPFGVWYGNYVGNSAYDTAPWCDMFLAYCASSIGELKNVGRFAYTPYHVQWFKDAKKWHNGTGGITRGDIVFFNWDGGEVDHVGIVETVSGLDIHTIEGNTGDACRRRIRRGNVVSGFGRPSYGATVSPPQPTVPEPKTKTPIPRPLLAVDGQFGAITTKALQRVLNYRDGAGLAVDGQFGTLTIKAFQRALNRGKL